MNGWVGELLVCFWVLLVVGGNGLVLFVVVRVVFWVCGFVFWVGSDCW